MLTFQLVNVDVWPYFRQNYGISDVAAITMVTAAQVMYSKQKGWTHFILNDRLA